MNQYQHQNDNKSYNQHGNEMQIIQPSSNSLLYSPNKYPYATDPNVIAEGRSYNNWLDTCVGVGDGTRSPETDAVAVGVRISHTIFRLLGVPYSAQGEQLFSFLLDTLWLEGNTQWEELMRHAEELINEQIPDYVRTKALAELTDLGNNLNLYIAAFEDWKRNPSSQEVRTRVIDRFNILDGLFEAYLPSFAVPGYEVPLLSVYANVANIHLLVLRDSSIHGLDWGLSSTSVDNNYNRQQRNSATYAIHCTTWYQTGLQRLQGSDASSWVNYNRFRREITLIVLDICALFSNYDVRSYPIQLRGELTRGIYTDPAVFSGTGSYSWLSQAPSFAEIENIAIREPSNFTWANYARVTTGTLEYLSSKNDFWKSHYMNYTETNSGILIQGPTYGMTTGTNIRIESVSMQEIYSVRLEAVAHAGAGGPFLGISTSEFFWSLGVRRYQNSRSPQFASQIITRQLPGVNSAVPSALDHSHELSYITAFPARSVGTILVHEWTSTTVSRNNRIEPDKITQIPAVKSHTLSNCQVVSGTGFTGGNWLRPSDNGSFRLTITSFSSQSYRIRIRYASATFFYLDIRTGDTSNTFAVTPTTLSSGSQTVPYESFGFINIPYTFTTAPTESRYTFDFMFYSIGSANVLIDRIEFVPIEGSLFEYETKQQLEKARKAVNHLFTDGSKKALKEDTTDYEIDQAANVVDCISDECGHEKMILLDEVKYAKQLSQARNLLLNGNFDDLYPALERENPWKTSPNVTIRRDNPIFKGHYLSMAGANDIEATNDTFPTYVYQKIDEAKLKPYTRYKVRGFVGSSKALELLVTRYNEEVDAILDVPDNIPHAPIPVCGEFDRCKPYSYPPLLPECNPEFINQMQPSSCHHTQMVDYNNMNMSTSTTMNPTLTPEIASSQSGFGRKHRKCHQAHQFEFHIDTGTIDLVEDLGLWVIFKICATDGYASLDDLEVIEEGALGVEALELVKKREKKWRHQKEQHCSQTKHKYDAAKHAVMALFTNTRYEKLKFETTISNILYADHLVQSIPYVYNKYVPEVPGMNYELYSELNTLVQNAFYLYDQRNLIKNGRFSNGLMYWQAAPHARVEQEFEKSVLVLPNWDANVSQDLCIEHNRGYVLRVTARKEDPGAGNVTFSDCENHVDKLSFTSCDIATNAVPGAQANDPAAGVAYGQQGCQIDRVPYGQSGYRADGVAYEQSGHRTDGVPYRQSGYGTDGVTYEQSGHRADGMPYGQSGYRADGVAYEQSGHRADGVPYGQSGYGTDGVTYDQSANQTRKYHGCHTDGLPHPEHGCCYPDRVSDGQQLAYVTKSIDLFPDTDKVRIDIGETEGNFRVESVELICMEK
uniref:Cryhime1 n=1 Tax=Paenibacillus popilliae TaxID=78057 RepID=Q589X2_PAEPP|nr:Cryhime1 [Paenibacillus popilliae]